jgi:hypothetical protein
MDLLTTHTHDAELQAITAPSLISRIHKSPQHQLSFFPACCVFTSRFLATVSNSGDSSTSSAQVLSSQSPMQNPIELCLLLITSKHGPHRKHGSPFVVSNYSIIKNLPPRNENVISEPLPINGRCLQSHCLVTGLYVTILSSQTFKYSFALCTLCKESMTRQNL